MKRILLLDAFLILATSYAHAGTMGPVCTKSSLTVPCLNSSWEFGGQALYLNTSYTGPYSIMGGTFTVTETTDETLIRRNPGFGWGFQLSAAYHFNTGNEININWYHLDNSNNSIFVNDDESFIDAANITYSSHTKTEWDAVNFEFAQHVNVSDQVNMRFYEGAQYGHIKNTSKLTVQSDPNGNTNSIPGDYVSSSVNYNGFGPRIGTDLSYDVFHGLSIYGKAATGLLIGTNKYSVFDTSGLLDSVRSVSYSSSIMVPELEGKLGGTYAFALNSGNIVLDGGYMWVNYFNAIQHANPGKVMATSNVAFNGPYFGAKWVGN